MTKNRILAALLAAALALSLSACGGPGNRVTALGSSSMDGVMGILAEQYGLDHPDVVVSVEGGGSSAGVEAGRAVTLQPRLRRHSIMCCFTP